MTAGHVALHAHPLKAVPCVVPGASAVTDLSLAIPTSANGAKTVRLGNTTDVKFEPKNAPLPMKSPTDDWLKVTVPNDWVSQKAASRIRRNVGGKRMVCSEMAALKADVSTDVSTV
jgi:hypothetical protein